MTVDWRPLRIRSCFGTKTPTRLQAIEQLLLATPFQPPGLTDMASHMAVDRSVVTKLVKILAEHRQVVQLADGIVMHCTAVEQAATTADRLHSP